MPKIIDAVERGSSVQVHYEDGRTGTVQLLGREFYDYGSDFVLISEHYGVCVKNGDGETVGIISRCGEIDSVRAVGDRVVVSQGGYRYTYDKRGNQLSVDFRG